MRVLLNIALLATLMTTAHAAVSLTTVEDVLYQANGAKFNGVVFVEWRHLVTTGPANVAGQSAVVRVADGLLRIQLVPTTTAPGGAYYSVSYYSGGRIQFREYWSVPPSSKPLKLSNVRIVGPPLAGNTLPPPEQTLLQIADVAGLAVELDARPVKGPGYAPGRAAWINESGQLEAVAGDWTDCVRVDGTAGPCGLNTPPGPDYVDGEIPQGALDGFNRVFTLSQTPQPASSLQVFRNGLLQKAGLDYVLNGNVITFDAAAVPQAGDILQCSYRVPAGSAPPSRQPVAYSPAQVICSGTGASTSSTALVNLASCQIPANVLRAGDRVEIRFSYGHQGTQQEYAFEVRWGGAPLVSRTAGSAEAYIAGKAEAGVYSSGVQWDVQSWGSSTAFSAAAGNVTASPASGAVIDFLGKLAASSSDTVALRNFTVLRYPATSQPQ